MGALALFPLKAAEHDLVLVTGKYTVAANGITLSGLDMPGVTAVARTSMGLHTLTLKDKFAKVLGASIRVLKTTGADLVGQVNADATLTGPNVSINFTRRKSYAEGGYFTAPTTPSTQATGSGNTTWNVNVSAMLLAINGVRYFEAAAADTAIHSGSKLLNNGQSIVAAVVYYELNGTVGASIIKGAAATTGAQVAPTDATIDAWVSGNVGAAATWLRLANLILNRTGDTTVTQTQDNTARPMPGCEASSGIGDRVVNVADPKSATILVTLLLKASGVNS